MRVLTDLPSFWRAAAVALAVSLTASGCGYEDSAEAAPISAPAPRLAPVVVEGLPVLAKRLATEAEAGRFMGAVLVARGDEVIFRQTYGMANIAAGEPLHLDSKFRLASVSKQFTAVALLKLQDQGVLKLDDPVCRWIQPCPEAWAPIRLVHLLNHSSGIPDLMQRPGWGAMRLTHQTPEQLTAASAEFKLSFEPGAKLRYNNAGFNLAGAVIAAASGRPYLDYLREEVLQPLGMDSTGFDDDTVPLATGYAHFPAGMTPQPDTNASIVLAAGGLYSTLDDLLVWNRALHRGGLLSPESYAAMIGRYNPPETEAEATRRRGPERDYGLGLFTATLGDRAVPAFHDKQIYHTGSWAGFRNLVTYQPDADVTVIVLSNNYHATAAVLLVSQQAMAEALGRPIPTELAKR